MPMLSPHQCDLESLAVPTVNAGFLYSGKAEPVPVMLSHPSLLLKFPVHESDSKFELIKLDYKIVPWLIK